MIGGKPGALVGPGHQPLWAPVFTGHFWVNIPFAVANPFAIRPSLGKSFFPILEGSSSNIAFWGFLVGFHVLQGLNYILRDVNLLVGRLYYTQRGFARGILAAA